VILAVAFTLITIGLTLFGGLLVAWLIFAEAFVAVRRLLGRDS